MADRIVFILADMEGVSGIDHWDQCFAPDDSDMYQWGREQLTAEANAAIKGCFEGGATEVRILDSHKRNQNRGFIDDRLDSRAQRCWIAQRSPLRFEGLDENVACVVAIGMHAMAGTLGAFLDHTQVPKRLCRYQLHGKDHGELSQIAAYAGSFGVPLVFASGDEALCAESKRLFPDVMIEPTKRGLGWNACDLYDPVLIRGKIQRTVAAAVGNAEHIDIWRPRPPIEVTIEWAYSGLADDYARWDGVERVDARTVRWVMKDARDVYTWPSKLWQPGRTQRDSESSSAG